MSERMKLIYFILVGCGCLLVRCSVQDPQPIDCAVSTLVITLSAKTDPEGCNINNGSITVQGSGGKTPYQFSLNTETYGSATTFNSLTGGLFVLHIRDANGCERELEVELATVGSTLAVTTEATADSECLEGNGSISVSITGGESPYEISLDNGAFESAVLFEDLNDGPHTVTIRDNTLCTIQKNITVPHGNTGISFQALVKPIIDNSCAISGCHNGDNGSARNWNVFANLVAHAADVKTFTQSGFMPQAGTLTAEQKTLIACWVDDGAPNN